MSDWTIFQLPFTYYLFEATLLVFPLVSLYLSLSEKLSFPKIRSYFLLAVIFLVVHIFSFYEGFSFRGDYPDYVCFSLTYLAFCLVVAFAWKETKNIFIKIFRVIGTCVMGMGLFVGLWGLIMFIVISQNFECNKKFSSTCSGKEYETRRYSFGGLDSMYLTYTFDTYRLYGFLPIERRIDRKEFRDDKTDVRMYEDGLERLGEKGEADD